MRTRAFACAVIVFGATSLAPSAANADPVNLAQTLLSKHEFPAGSSGYRVLNSTQPTLPNSSALTDDPCELAVMRLSAISAGSQSSEAVATRGRTYMSVELTDRPLAVVVRAVIEACRSRGGETIRITDTPQEFKRYGLVAGTLDKTPELQGWAEVRGITVAVIVDAGPGPADYQTFWQLLRAQIAKVERAR